MTWRRDAYENWMKTAGTRIAPTPFLLALRTEPGILWVADRG
jgi:hypothetical protein